jgi:hypothetical protein
MQPLRILVDIKNRRDRVLEIEPYLWYSSVIANTNRNHELSD